jgi:hypothetical protein
MVRIKPCEVENSTVAAISNSVLSIKELPQPGREHIKTNDINYKFDSVFDYKLNQEEFFDQIKDYYVPHLLSGQSASIFSCKQFKNFIFFPKISFFFKKINLKMDLVKEENHLLSSEKMRYLLPGMSFKKVKLIEWEWLQGQWNIS